ncbi:serine/threonine-protein phosphatase 7 long form homolog [Chenopodium quinoa]|uniref:serine/threonine-protein phosphatase 7 long form homolog n=1 Tax=Chenopodium quinoa TaxID=63459 RepID=UPI000B772CCC|nr:serine/threonine-protein phosphatase 7 long form homolog [Chenopodium quinoa]
MVSFKGTPNPQRLWKSWIDELQPTHQSIWKKVGIFDAILSSGYYIKKDNELIISLAEKWCSKTNTFIFSWGECTITLEDVMILGGFPVLGVSVLTPSKNRNFDDIEASLVNSCSEIMSNSNNLVTHLGWMKYFKGKGGHLEHVAFLVLWLSRYVFPTNVYNTIAPNLFSIAISLANGTKIALAHAVLASIYRDLSLLNEKIVSFISCAGENGNSKLVLTAPLYLVHVRAWERFTRLGKKPKFLARGEPRLARWRGSKKSKNGSLRLQDVESFGDDFLWRPYALNVKNWEVPKFYCDQGMWLLLNSAMG